MLRLTLSRFVSRVICIQFCLTSNGISSFQMLKEVRQLSKQPLLTSTIQVRRLAVFGHIARMDDSAGAKRL